MSKGSGRRRENTALVEANWPFPDRKADQALADQMRADNLERAKPATEVPETASEPVQAK